MRIYLDPIYTGRPSHCASHAKMKKIVLHMLQRLPDLIFYWQRPPGLDEEQLAAYPVSDRIRFVEYPYVTIDRLREYLRIDRVFYDNLNFQGIFWDVDMVITNRAQMVPIMRALMNKPGRTAMLWSKRIFLIEDMPMMDFKLTVPLSAPEEQTLQALIGYATANVTAISAFWEKDFILQAAREYLSAGMVRRIRDRVFESSPVLVEKTGVKTKAVIEQQLKGERAFTMAFCGRMTHATRSEDIFSLMGKHWIMRGGKTDRPVRCIASTQSAVKPNADGSINRAGRVNIPSWVEVKNLPREGFWQLMQEEVDVLVFLSPEEDYSMSLMEPLILGTPAVLIDCRWSRPSVGDDYPFFVKTLAEAYAMIKAFYDDYPAMYAKFVAWSRGSFQKLMSERNSTYVPLLVEQECARWRDDFTAAVPKSKSLNNNEVVNLLDEYGTENGGEMTVWPAVEALEKAGKLQSLLLKTTQHFLASRKLTFGTDWNLFRLGLMAKGWVDASTTVGHMRKVKA